MLIHECDYTRDLCLIPLSMVQVTWFKCGGFGLGFALHHHVADGPAHAEFVVKFLTLVAGFDIPISPVHDRIHVAPRDPLCIKFKHLLNSPPLITVTKDGVKTEKDESEYNEADFKIAEKNSRAIALLQAGIGPHDYNRISGCTTAKEIWETIEEAKDLSKLSYQELFGSLMAHEMTLNKRLGESSKGNSIALKAESSDIEEDFDDGLVIFAKRFKGSLKGILGSKRPTTNKKQFSGTTTRFTRPDDGHKIMYPDLMINSWVKFSFYKADFGLGPPKAVGNCDRDKFRRAFVSGRWSEGR
ncbi:hypothetical protein RND81_02G109200 [Saponaria officinalis]|uniref:Uncharacterized protein n=1 Tax=Saponaria officinalis TaxID=3572 RepID=A0AAW1MTG3_SAPOF